MCATITLFRTDKFHETFVANHGFNQILCNTCDMYFITITCLLLIAFDANGASAEARGEEVRCSVGLG